MRWLLASMLALGSAAFAEGAAWQVRSDADGVQLETQEVAGSAYENVRVTCTSRASPRGFMAALWGKATDSSPSPEVVKRDVLLDEAQERRYYDVVHAPPASDRDYVMHERWAEDEGGTITMHFATLTDERKPITAARVRFGKVAGTATIAPAPGGGSAITYVVFTDLGGTIPAWLTRGAQREAAKKFVLEIRHRAEEGMAK